MGRRAHRLAALLGTGAAVLCTPPVARPLICIDELLPVDVASMWAFSAGLLALSWLVVDRTGRRRRWVVGAFVSLLALVAAECGARVYLKTLASDWQRSKLSRLGWATYRTKFAYQPHPFLHYTGRPGQVLQSTDIQRGWGRINARGFHGPDIDVAKPDGTVRVACLGASTTASGYPTAMARWLDREAAGAAGAATSFECMNLGHGFYTSNHSTVNFILNVLDYRPDYVVFHQGWNDGRCAANGADFRGDYSHMLKAFDFPSVPDALLLRASTIYRLVKIRVFGQIDWAYLDRAIFRPDDPSSGRDMGRVVQTYQRNVRTIVELARRRGMTPVLVTQPHSTASGVKLEPTRPDLARFSAVLRDLAAEWGDAVLFVDLDRELTGKNDLFVDVGHLSAEGIELKAAKIGAAILAHWRRGR